MRNSFFFIAIFAIVCSCNNAEQAPASDQPQVAAEGAGAAPAATVVAAKTDPVCEMTYDTTWTENTVYMNDTVHFCSENCKTAFLARPEKYMKSKQ